MKNRADHNRARKGKVTGFSTSPKRETRKTSSKRSTPPHNENDRSSSALQEKFEEAKREVTVGKSNQNTGRTRPQKR